MSNLEKLKLTQYGFDVLQIESTAACNMACSFCPYPLKDDSGKWLEKSNYLLNQHGLKRVETLEQTDLDTGIHRYLLIAVNTSSLITRIKHSTVIINP